MSKLTREIVVIVEEEHGLRVETFVTEKEVDGREARCHKLYHG